MEMKLEDNIGKQAFRVKSLWWDGTTGRAQWTVCQEKVEVGGSGSSNRSALRSMRFEHEKMQSRAPV